MPIDLIIEAVPDDIVAYLPQRALDHRCSLETEVLAILEAAVPMVPPRRFTVDEILARVRRLGIGTPTAAASIVRDSR